MVSNHCCAPQELHLTGIAVATDGLCLVMAEGGAKAQKKYAKLLLHRINWAAGRDEDADAGAAGGTRVLVPCSVLVWHCWL